MIAEKLDLFSGSLPHKCLYCRYGYPVVFGTEDWLSCLMCGANVVEGLKSKKLTLKLTEWPWEKPDAPYAPLVAPWCSCEGFRPVRWMPSHPGEWCNTRKMVLLDKSGMFDEMEAKPWA